MRINKDLYSKNPIEEFDSKFKYAWNSEKSRVTAEHYCVTWTVENLSLLMVDENHKSISSPVFRLDASGTEWFVKFYPNGLCDEAQNLDLCLCRCDNDDGSGQEVGLTFRFGVSLNEHEILWLKEKKMKCVRQKTGGLLRIRSPEREALSQNALKHRDVLVIKCEMYVTFPDSSWDEQSLTPADHDLLNFSLDFTKLMMAIEIADYRVKIPGININAHRAVLAARSSTFRQILRQENSKSEYHLGGTSYDSIRRVLHFMYSGRLSVALAGEPPSIGLYECAEQFAVVDLMIPIVPKFIQLRSVLKSQEICYTWSVTRFTKRPPFGLMSVDSPGFGIPRNSCWRLSLNFDRLLDRLGVWVETTRETTKAPLYSVLKISLLDGNGEPFNTRVITTTRFGSSKKQQPGNNKKSGFPDFLRDFTSQNTMHDLLINDTLRVRCEISLVVSDDGHESHQLDVAWPSQSGMDNVRNLSRNIRQHLYETPEFSDVAVRTRDNSTFDVHRSVLFARSRKFYSKFLYYNRDDRILEVFDVEPDLVRLMLEHAYSGILRERLSVDDLLRVHRAAELYVFRGLSLVTHQLLASNIDDGNFFDCLVEAKTLKDGYLEEKCMLYVRENAKKILVTADWDAFRSKDLVLCEFLITVLSEEAVK